MTNGAASLAVVVLHYGDPARTTRLHQQLRKTDPDWTDRILVLDNHAPEPYPDAFHRTDFNMFWAGALDWCVRHVREAGCTHLWFLNNDLYFLTKAPIIAKALARLDRIERAEGPVGVYAPCVSRNPYHAQMVHISEAAYALAPYADGIAPLINLKCLEAVGGLDHADNPVGYGVETWLSLRAHRAGWPVVIDHGLEIRHTYHATAKAVTGFMERAARLENAYMNSRLGPDWREQLATLQQQTILKERLP